MKRLLLLPLLLIIAGCNSGVVFTKKAKDVKAPIVLEQRESFSGWKDLAKGLSFARWDNRDKFGNDKNLVVVKIDPSQYSFQLVQNTENAKSVKKWRDEYDAYVVINGGFFDEEFQSTGMLKMPEMNSGAQTMNGSFGYTGMLIIDNDGVDIQYLPDNPLTESQLNTMVYGLQSYPTLILPGGKDGLDEEKDHLARRSIIAKDMSGNILFIVTPNSKFSLSEIMHRLTGSDLNIDIALNLDGGSSTGLSVRVGDFEFDAMSALVPNVIMIK